MVANVGPSYNVLSLFQKPSGSAATADTTAVNAIIDKIQQMKADASPARLQGASAATQAWIESSEVGTDEAEGRAAGAQSGAAVGAATSSGTARASVVQSGPDGVIRAVHEFNSRTKSLNGSLRYIEKLKSDISSETAPDKLTRLNSEIKTLEKWASIDGSFLEYFDTDFQTELNNVSENYSLSGSIAQKNNDGTLSYGAFEVSTKADGLVYWKHDGSGTAIRFNNDGASAYAYDLETWHETLVTAK